MRRRGSFKLERRLSWRESFQLLDPRRQILEFFAPGDERVFLSVHRHLLGGSAAGGVARVGRRRALA